MKYGFVFFILLLGSLSLALPLTSPTENIRLFPNTQEEVLIQISQPNLEIKSTDGKSFSINITYVDGNRRNVIDSFSSISEKVWDGLEPGFYQISLKSVEVTDITIDPQGIFFASIIIISILTIVNLVYQFRKYL